MTVKTIKSVEELFESILLTHVQWLFVFNKTNWKDFIFLTKPPKNIFFTFKIFYLLSLSPVKKLWGI